MPNVLIRDLPQGVHGVLVDRARSKGLSLQAYLQLELERLAQTVSFEEVLDQAARQARGSFGFAQAVEALDEVRAEQDDRL